MSNLMEDLLRTDYPRPQWVRENWTNLNGLWQFAFDFSDSGAEGDMITAGEYPLNIRVPFCPESKLSGIGYTDFIPAVWYRRTVTLDTLPAGRLLLNFGAVDHTTAVYVNGSLCGTHVGGYTAFSVDITPAMRVGENVITVHARDNLRSGKQPHGKQCFQRNSTACSYTRTTGIWQTVWMEEVPKRYLQRAKMIPQAEDGTLNLTVFGKGVRRGDKLRVRASYKGKDVGCCEASFAGDVAYAQLVVTEKHLWNPGASELYDLALELVDSEGVVDRVESYFALRDVALTDKALTINGKPVFMRLILDQGFNPDGLYTGLSDAFLRRDIELMMDLGFNGARLHQRVFEERTLYWADRLGYIVWGEYALGLSVSDAEGLELMLPEWIESVEQGFNHPALIGWAPLNETYHVPVLDQKLHETIYSVTKKLDPSRPVIDASGGTHYETDMYDVHDYEQNPEKLKEYLAPMLESPDAYHCPISRYTNNRHPENYKGQPYWVSEYGGTLWDGALAEQIEGWGYGDAPKTQAEFAQRYAGLTKVLLEHPRVCGFCYTQLTDIEQEQNGLYNYDRSPKFDDFVYDVIRQANQMAAAIEQV